MPKKTSADAPDTSTAPTMMDAVRDALAAGKETAEDGVAYIKEKFGLDTTTRRFSNYKSSIRVAERSGAAPAAKKSRAVEPAPKPRPVKAAAKSRAVPAAARTTAPEPTPAITAGDVAATLEVAEMVRRVGLDRVRQVIDYLSR